MKQNNLKLKIQKFIKESFVLISIILSLFIACGLKLEFFKDTNFLGFTTREHDMIYLIFIIGVFSLIYYNFKIKDKRLWHVSILVGIIFAICYYLGDIQNVYMYTYVPTSKKFILYSFIKLLSYFILFTNCIIKLFSMLPKIISKLKTKNESAIFQPNKKNFFIITLIFFISYLPYFLYYYPGNVNLDSIGSLYQITGMKKYSNFQPLLYTLILGGLWNLGKAVFGSSVAGIAVYTIFQMICTSLVFSTILYYMAKRKVSTKLRTITFLFLLLNPINGWFAVRCEKGMLFHLSLILVIIGIEDIIYEKERFFEKKWKPILLAIITLIMVLIRNNGIYSLILTLPFLILSCKKIWKQVTILFGTILMAVIIIQGPIFQAFDIVYSAPGEALTIPMQQYARITKYASDRISDEDRKIIQKYFPVSIQKLSEDYTPWKSDSTKSNFSADQFVENKTEFLIQYLKFAFKFPVQTISSLVLNTGNNYSPNFRIWGILRNYGTETQDAYNILREEEGEEFSNFIKLYNIEGEPLVDFRFLDNLNQELIKGNIPIISNLFENIGFYFWIIVLCSTYCIYTKKYHNIVMMLPILGLWATTVAAPMVDLRYIYSMFLTVPLFIAIIFKECEINNGIKE